MIYKLFDRKTFKFTNWINLKDSQGFIDLCCIIDLKHFIDFKHNKGIYMYNQTIDRSQRHLARSKTVKFKMPDQTTRNNSRLWMGIC